MSEANDDMKDDYSAEIEAAIANGTAVRGKLGSPVGWAPRAHRDD